MFDFIKGEIITKNTTTTPSTIVLENNNIGYLINTTLRTINKLPDSNEFAKIYVSLIHKEDAMLLCGFSTREERDIFNILQTVSGVGQKVSLVLLNEFDVYELIAAVINEDSNLISKAKGIGPKLAKKIVLELKDKLNKYPQKVNLSVEINDNRFSEELISEVQAVLYSFGYTEEEIKSAIDYGTKNVDKKSAEELLKVTLKYLSQM